MRSSDVFRHEERVVEKEERKRDESGRRTRPVDFVLSIRNYANVGNFAAIVVRNCCVVRMYGRHSCPVRLLLSVVLIHAVSWSLLDSWFKCASFLCFAF